MDTAYDPDWLTKAMEKTGIATGKLSSLTGVSRSQIQRIRNGAPPRMDTHEALRLALRTGKPIPNKINRPRKKAASSGAPA